MLGGCSCKKYLWPRFVFTNVITFLSAFVLRNLNFSFKVDKAILIGAFFYTLMAFIHFFVTPIFANSNYIGVCGLIFLVIFFSKQTKFFIFFL